MPGPPATPEMHLVAPVGTSQRACVGGRQPRSIHPPSSHHPTLTHRREPLAALAEAHLYASINCEKVSSVLGVAMLLLVTSRWLQDQNQFDRRGHWPVVVKEDSDILAGAGRTRDMHGWGWGWEGEGACKSGQA